MIDPPANRTARTLVLLRHGKSAYPGGVTDHGRPLSERGRREAALAGEWIRTNLPPVDRVLCSSATRTRETFAATGLTAPVDFADEIYGASADEILDVVASADPDLRTVLVIGHAPGLPNLAGELAGPDSDPQALDALYTRFPTSALAVLSVPGAWADLDSAEAALVELHIPRV